MNLKQLLFVSLLLIFGFAATSQAQDAKLSPNEKKVQKEEKKKEREAIENMLKAYTSCSFDNKDKFVIAQVERIAKDKEENLARETAEGEKGISRTDSYRVMTAFTDTPKDLFGRPYYFANIRPDRSKPTEYDNDKRVLIEYLEHLIISGNNTITIQKPLEKNYHGFDVYSIYRSIITGNNLGVSIIFDDGNKMSTTIYFLSEPKGAKAISHFKTFEEWMILRDKLLESYTKCVAENLK